MRYEFLLCINFVIVVENSKDNNSVFIYFIFFVIIIRIIIFKLKFCVLFVVCRDLKVSVFVCLLE